MSPSVVEASITESVVPVVEPLALVKHVEAVGGGVEGGDPSPVREDGQQHDHHLSKQAFQTNPVEKQVYEAPMVVPASEGPGKEEEEDPPDKVNEKQKIPPKPNPYEVNPKFPQIFPCGLCPRKFSFTHLLCTHV
jgi:hypothetical protein